MCAPFTFLSVYNKVLKKATLHCHCSFYKTDNFIQSIHYGEKSLQIYVRHKVGFLQTFKHCRELKKCVFQNLVLTKCTRIFFLYF